MKTESRTRLTWLVNSRSMIEPLFRSRQTDSSRLPRSTSFSVEDKWLHRDLAKTGHLKDFWQDYLAVFSGCQTPVFCLRSGRSSFAVFCMAMIRGVGSRSVLV